MKLRITPQVLASPELQRTLLKINSSSIANTGDDPGDGDNILIKDSSGLKTGKYSKTKIINLIRASKALGSDPSEAAAIAIQENAFGKSNPKGNSGGRRRGSQLGNVEDALDERDQSIIDQYSAKGLDRDSLRLALALKRKNEYAAHLGFNEDASRLQAYNGYGVITPKMFGGATKAYGVDISNGVDLKKNPLYGKRIVSLKKDLMSNKDFSALLTQ